jgi:hypothetical protein
MKQYVLLVLLILSLAILLVPDLRSDDVSISTMVTMEISGMT